MSASFIARMKAGGQALVEAAREGKMSAGNAYPIEFTEDFAKDHGISVLGRVTLKDGVNQYHAGPIHIERKAYWKVHTYDFIDSVQALGRGEEYTFNQEKFAPYYTYEEEATGVPHRYEPRLLKAVSRLGHITLVNPAVGTVFRCAELDFSILLTRNDATNFNEIHGVLQKINRNDVQFIDEPVGYCYLGSNGVRQKQGEKWFSLLPNPFVENFPYQSYNLFRNKNGVVLNYERKSRMVRAELLYEPDHFRYSPGQVDSEFFSSGKTGGKSYFLESNFDLGDLQSDSSGEHIFFLPDFPRCGYDTTFLYDIPGTDTYLSRRGRMEVVAKERGLKVCPLLLNGVRGISYYTTSPVKSHFNSLWYDSSQSWRSFTHEGGDCEIYGLDGPVRPARLDEGIFSSVAYIYGENNSQGDPVNIFPRGGISTVPYDPVNKFYNFHFRQGGVYFFFTHISQIFAYQLTVLSKLYRSLLRGKVGYSLPPAFPTCKVEVSVFSRISERTNNHAGVTLEELSSALALPKCHVMAILPRLPHICSFSRNGVIYLCNVEKVDYEVWVDGVARQLWEVWDLWVMNRKIIVDRAIDVEYLRNFFFSNGRPCVHVIPLHMKYEMKGCKVRERIKYTEADVIFDELPESYF